MGANLYLNFIDRTKFSIALNKVIPAAEFTSIKKVKQCPIDNRKRGILRCRLKWSQGNEVQTNYSIKVEKAKLSNCKHHDKEGTSDRRKPQEKVG